MKHTTGALSAVSNVNLGIGRPRQQRVNTSVVYHGKAFRKDVKVAFKSFAVKQTKEGSKGFGAKKANEDRTTEGKNIPCPCSSGLQYKDCCSRFHAGGWAPTPLDAARARISANHLGLLEHLANSRHPESMGSLGGSKSAQQAAARESRRYRGMTQAKLLDQVGARLEDQDIWLVMLALLVQETPQDSPQIAFLGYHYVKHNGQWLFLGEAPTYPGSEPYHTFMERWEAHDPSNPQGTSTLRCSLRPPWRTLERAPWLVDAWKEDTFVYLEEPAADQEPEAAREHNGQGIQDFFDSKQQEDYEKWLYRQGRF